jgi:hypothetical protein
VAAPNELKTQATLYGRKRPNIYAQEMIEMKYLLGMTIAFAFLLSSLESAHDGKARAQTSAAEKNQRPVIVELFTSEGCSTCPPADALLAQLEDRQPVEGVDVIALEEHVDYWNQQGWSDPFSGSEWTLRQQDYLAIFKGDTVYTPQMIVDGQSQFIGSRIREVMTAIGEASRSSKTNVLMVPVVSGDNRSPQFTVSVGKLAGGTDGDTAEVWLAVTEKGLHSEVSRGENAGKNLHHAAIVRWMRKVGVADGRKTPLSFAGNTSVKLKPAWKMENLRVVAFVQEKASRHILGAASMRLTPIARPF